MICLMENIIDIDTVNGSSVDMIKGLNRGALNLLDRLCDPSLHRIEE